MANQGFQIESVTLKHLFVYGTLQSFCNNKFAKLLQSSAIQKQEASICGILFNCGTKDYPYPGVILSTDEKERVYGEVYTIESSEFETIIEILDEYEEIGEAFTSPYEYKKEEVVVKMIDDSTIIATVYVYNFSIANLKNIASGKWTI
jgi:gamma-glutamylcyclotransferase (GGCT)/AIG2-like uncharacterized protein YtfP